MKVGDHIKVQESVLVYHHPEHKKEAFDLKGMEGELIEIITEWQGRPVSANFPYLVKFDKKFKAHFREHEIKTISN
ncbi:ferredoxin-thioredoxin reductase variable chain [Geminocystis sp. GBBB08]|uniref:ferredoxin-thioredoxin reductase variable chain n=1 Tax=Geminocystis sp. GBBB08 TaxID=2604140 RepID=UPI0027E28141|nr:ferredoxin-thioredoxin reductase variable chain [Geminocystis sp. GBBB08]MBL1211454.1 ferredoxin--nitrite reductase [Geminocystis sp. GBBB08]